MTANLSMLREASRVHSPRKEALLPPKRWALRLRLQAGLMVLDVTSLVLGIVLANLVWLGSFNDEHNQRVVALLVPIYLLAGANAGAFSAESLPLRRIGLLRALRCVLLAASCVILVAFLLKEGQHISRAALLLGCAFSIFLLVVFRAVFHGRMRARYGASLHSEVIILDESEFTAPPGAFVLDAGAVGLRCDMRDPMMLDRIGRLVDPADRVVIVCPESRRREWAMVLKGANIRGEIISPELMPLGPMGTGWVGDAPTVVVSAGSLNLQQRMLKRGFDLGVATIAILILAPLLLLVAIVIKMDSPGPVLFRQDRVGRGNRLFGVFKFRSMRADASDLAGDRSTKRGDDRVTRVGRIIRATSIDELPQLFNILKGDMSFVGPRPHALGSLAGDLLFWEIDERYWHRHACKPGMTGLAQVRGFRGATHSRSDLVNRLQADLEYNSGWTIWRDISILLATFRVVVHRNAF